MDYTLSLRVSLACDMVKSLEYLTWAESRATLANTQVAFHGDKEAHDKFRDDTTPSSVKWLDGSTEGFSTDIFDASPIDPAKGDLSEFF